MTDTNSQQSLLAGYCPQRDAATELGVTLRTMRNYDLTRTGPPPTKIGRKVYYEIGAFRQWLKSLERAPVRSPKNRAAA